MGILDDFSLAGLRAVVTGGGKGIGRGIALCLAEAGADVLVSARTQSDVDAVADEISALGRSGYGHVADVTLPGQEMIDKQMRIPLERIGSERDIGGAVVFLASPAASWITGQVLLVNGGR